MPSPAATTVIGEETTELHCNLEIVWLAGRLAGWLAGCLASAPPAVFCHHAQPRRHHFRGGGEKFYCNLEMSVCLSVWLLPSSNVICHHAQPMRMCHVHHLHG